MSLEDTLIRRQIFLQRFAGGRAAEAEKILLNILRAAAARLRREQDQVAAARLARLIQDIQALTARGFEELNEKIIADALAIAESEVAFSVSATNLHVNVELATPAFAQIEQAVLMEGMDAVIGPGTVTLRESLDQFSAKKSTEIQRAISDGILSGRGINEISDDILALSNRHQGQVNALVRTSINHAGSQARKAFSTENQGVIEGEEWLATLDSRTSLICGGRDGRIYPVGGGPYPPAHWNCRSLRVPIIKEEFAIRDTGTKRPEVGADGAGQVTGATKFDGWLRRQPAGFQDEYFAQFPDGADKAALFRRGGLGIQQFRDETGRNYTLDQLQALEPLAFEKANITSRPVA